MPHGLYVAVGALSWLTPAALESASIPVEGDTETEPNDALMPIASAPAAPAAAAAGPAGYSGVGSRGACVYA